MNIESAKSLNFPARMLELDGEFTARFGDAWSMIAFDEMLRSHQKQFGIRGWVPALGEAVWELPEAVATKMPFVACIYRTVAGLTIGYLRIPHYSHHEPSLAVLEDVISHFESNTSALVLDQVDNPGGSLFHMYSVTSYFTDVPLPVPTHEITIDEDAAAMAADVVALANAGDAVPLSERPSPEMVTYSRLVLSERAAGRGTGRRLAGPLHLCGVTSVRPARSPYTKKIVVLINELDFSASEFLAAILQDNKRATLFGQNTAGAGGCVKKIVADNRGRALGVDSYTITWTVARRTSGQHIEGIGVQPDIPYEITVEDVQHEYVGYRQALLAAIRGD